MKKIYPFQQEIIDRYFIGEAKIFVEFFARRGDSKSEAGKMFGNSAKVSIIDEVESK